MAPTAQMAVRSELERMLDEYGRGAATVLARMLDLTPQTVSKWKTGQVPVPPERWVAIPAGLGADPLRLVRSAAEVEPQLRPVLERLEEAEPTSTDLGAVWTRSIVVSNGRAREDVETADDLSRMMHDMKATLDELSALVQAARSPQRLRIDELLDRATPAQLKEIQADLEMLLDPTPKRSGTKGGRTRTISEEEHRRAAGD